MNPAVNGSFDAGNVLPFSITVFHCASSSAQSSNRDPPRKPGSLSPSSSNSREDEASPIRSAKELSDVERVGHVQPTPDSPGGRGVRASDDRFPLQGDDLVSRVTHEFSDLSKHPLRRSISVRTALRSGGREKQRRGLRTRSRTVSGRSCSKPMLLTRPVAVHPHKPQAREGRQHVDFCEAGRKAKGGRKRRRRETHCSRLELPELIPLEWCARSLPSGGFLSPTPSRSSSGSPCYAHHQPEEQRRGKSSESALRRRRASEGQAEKGRASEYAPESLATNVVLVVFELDPSTGLGKVLVAADGGRVDRCWVDVEGCGEGGWAEEEGEGGPHGWI